MLSSFFRFLLPVILALVGYILYICDIIVIINILLFSKYVKLY